MKRLFIWILVLALATPFAACAEEAALTPYAWYAAETLPKIYITTENGMALDDSSLILPDEHKGMNGEITVYDYVNATITVTDCEGFELEEAAGKVKIRGNYTSNYPKKPIRIKFDEGQAMCGLNGGAALKSWVLLAEYKDPSLLRNSVAFYVANSLYSTTGNYCTDFRNVEVYLNGEYNGLYVLAEQQQVNKARVNLPQPENPAKYDLETLTEEELAALKDPHTGYFFEYDGYYTNEDTSVTFTIRYDEVVRPNGQRFLPTSEGNAAANTGASAGGFTNLTATAQTGGFVNVSSEGNSNGGSNGGSANENNGDNNDGGASNGWGWGNGNALGDTRQTGFTIKSDIYCEEQRAFLQHTVQTVWDVCYDAVYGDHSDLAANPFHTMDGDGNYIAAPEITTAYDAVASVVDIDSLIDMYIIQEICEDSDLDWSSFYFSIDMSPEGSHLLTYTAPWDFDSGFSTGSNRSELYAVNADNPWMVLFCHQDWFWQLLCRRWDEAAEAGVFTGVLEMLDTLPVINQADYEKNRERWPSGGEGADGASFGGSAGGSSETQAQAAQSLRDWLAQKLEKMDRLIHEAANGAAL